MSLLQHVPHSIDDQDHSSLDDYTLSKSASLEQSLVVELAVQRLFAVLVLQGEE